MLVSVRAGIKLRYLWVNDTSFILSKLFRVGVKKKEIHYSQGPKVMS